MKLTAPEGASCVSVAGQTYRVIDGAVDVPAEYAQELAAHGFVPEAPQTAQRKRKASE